MGGFVFLAQKKMIKRQDWLVTKCRLRLLHATSFSDINTYTSFNLNEKA